MGNACSGNCTSNSSHSCHKHENEGRRRRYPQPPPGSQQQLALAEPLQEETDLNQHPLQKNAAVSSGHDGEDRDHEVFDDPIGAPPTINEDDNCQVIPFLQGECPPSPRDASPPSPVGNPLSLVPNTTGSVSTPGSGGGPLALSCEELRSASYCSPPPPLNNVGTTESRRPSSYSLQSGSRSLSRAAVSLDVETLLFEQSSEAKDDDNDVAHRCHRLAAVLSQPPSPSSTCVEELLDRIDGDGEDSSHTCIFHDDGNTTSTMDPHPTACGTGGLLSSLRSPPPPPPPAITTGASDTSSLTTVNDNSSNALSDSALMHSVLGQHNAVPTNNTDVLCEARDEDDVQGESMTGSRALLCTDANHPSGSCDQHVSSIDTAIGCTLPPANGCSITDADLEAAATTTLHTTVTNTMIAGCQKMSPNEQEQPDDGNIICLPSVLCLSPAAVSASPPANKPSSPARHVWRGCRSLGDDSTLLSPSHSSLTSPRALLGHLGAGDTASVASGLRSIYMLAKQADPQYPVSLGRDDETSISMPSGFGHSMFSGSGSGGGGDDYVSLFHRTLDLQDGAEMATYVCATKQRVDSDDDDDGEDNLKAEENDTSFYVSRHRQQFTTANRRPPPSDATPPLLSVAATTTTVTTIEVRKAPGGRYSRTPSVTSTAPPCVRHD